MQDFISWYKEALEISGTNYGDILNQKTEFFRRIDPRIVAEIRTWEVSNPNPTMEQIYAIAQGFEMNHTGMTPYMGIAPLTNRNDRRITRQRNKYSNNIEVENIEAELSNMSLYEQHQNEIDNITGTFSGGVISMDC